MAVSPSPPASAGTRNATALSARTASRSTAGPAPPSTSAIGDPRQRRITQKALTKPLAAVARIRKRNPNADWHAMAENWNILVRRCKRSARARRRR